MRWNVILMMSWETFLYGSKLTKLYLNVDEMYICLFNCGYINMPCPAQALQCTNLCKTEFQFVIDLGLINSIRASRPLCCILERVYLSLFPRSLDRRIYTYLYRLVLLCFCAYNKWKFYLGHLYLLKHKFGACCFNYLVRLLNYIRASSTKLFHLTYRANMGPIWGRQDPGGPHVGPKNLPIWGTSCNYAPITL